MSEPNSDEGIVANDENNENTIDEEEVSLSDTSLSTDSSGDEEYEDSGAEEEEGEYDDLFASKDDDVQPGLQHEFSGLVGAKSRLVRRSISDVTAQTSHHDSRIRRERHTLAVSLGHHHGASASDTRPELDYFKLGKKSRSRRGYLDAIPSSSLDNGKIPMSMTLTMAKQHVQLARSCLDLIYEKDRQDALRRRNLRLAMLNDGSKSSNSATMIDQGVIEEDDNDDDCPLLTMIKSGPLYKLHIKGGRTTSKSLSRKMSWQMNNEEKGTKNATISQKLLTRWKPKFVEVRKGMFSYYDDSRKSGVGLVRKSTPLQASTCVCQAVDYFGTEEIAHDVDGEEHSPPSGQLFAFELKVPGTPARLFAAGTEAGRRAWIQSICKGMVGNEDDTGAHRNDIMDESSVVDAKFTTQVKSFMAHSESANTATTAASYTETFVKPLSGSSISLPIKVISPMLTEAVADQQKVAKGDHVDMQHDLHNDQDKFLHMLKQYNFVVNEETLRGQSIHGPERAYGALMRSMLHFDKVSRGNDSSPDSDGREMMAARYARDFLKASAGEYKGRVASLDMAVKTLCKNQKELALVRNVTQNKPSSSATKSPTITICLNGINPNITPNTVHQRSSAHDKRAWLHVRHNKYKRPKQCFVVLSVGVMCFYKEAKPKPHQLIEQILLVGARIGFYTAAEQGSQGGLGYSSHHTTDSVGKNEEGSMVSSERNSHQSSDAPQSLKQPKFIIYVVSNEKKGGERHLCFTDFEKFSEWRGVLMTAVKTCSSPPILGVKNPVSVGEFASNEQQLVSTLSDTPETFETDNKGITWVIQSNGRLHTSTSSSMDVSSSRNLTRRSSDSLSMMPSLSLIGQIAASRIIDDNSIVHSIRAISGMTKKFTSNSSDSGEIMDGDVESKSVEPSIELEVKFVTFHHLLMKKDPKGVAATIRTTWSHRHELSLGVDGELAKDKEIIKIDTLKGEVKPSTFEQIFDNIEKKARRSSSCF